jgi:hypothetical protein
LIPPHEVVILQNLAFKQQSLFHGTNSSSKAE